MPRSRSKDSSGLTMIELMVSIIVLSVLVGLTAVYVNVGGVRGKARDTQRKADLETLQTAIELYYARHRHYPISDIDNDAATIDTRDGGWINLGEAPADNSLHEDLVVGGYINAVPVDPLSNINNPGPCNNPDRYRYNYRSDGSYYLLTAIMEVHSSDDESKCKETTPGWGRSGCTGSGENTTWNHDPDFCYAVQNQ